MLILRIIDTNQNNYFPQKIENFSMQKIHYGGASELNFTLEENPSFQNHKVGLFNNVYLYNFSKLIWQGYITKFQRNFIKSNFTLKASGLVIDFRNKRIKKTYVLDDIGEFKNWNEKNNKESDEILYGYSQAREEKGIKISLLQRSYNAEEDGLFEIKIDENIERLKARILLSQPTNFTTKLVTLDENHSNPYTEKSWANAQKIDEDVILDIIKTEIEKEVYTFNFTSDDGKWPLVDAQISGGVLDITAIKGYGQRSPNVSWLSGKNDDFIIEVDFKQDSVPSITSMEISLRLIGDTNRVHFYLYGTKMYIEYAGTNKAEQNYTQDTNWHTAKIRRVGTTYYFSIDDGSEIYWNYKTARELEYLRLGYWDCMGEFDTFKYSFQYSTKEGVYVYNEKRYLQFRVECTANQAISTDKHFAQLENLKLLTADTEMNAANILKDLLLNHTQKLDLDTSLIQNCFNYKDIELCESLTGWDSGLNFLLENTVIKEGSYSIKTIVGLNKSYLFDFAIDDGNWILNNATITGGTLNVTGGGGYGQRSPEANWLSGIDDNFIIRIKFKLNILNTNASVQLYLIGDANHISFYTRGGDNQIRIRYDGVDRDTEVWVEDTDWHTMLIYRIGTVYKMQIDAGNIASWDYGTKRAINYIRVGAGSHVDVKFDDFRYSPVEQLTKTLSPTQNLQNKNLLRLWVRSTITGDILKVKFGENLKYQYELPWSCKYEANQEPDAAEPVWIRIGVDYASVADGILTINKTGANECSYKRENIGHNIKGNTILTRMKCDNAAKTTILSITDGIAKAVLAIYKNKIEDWWDAANSYTIDMTEYRELWLTMKNNFWMLYVDGVFVLCGETVITAGKLFHFGMDSSANLGKSYWDYVYYYNLGFLRNKRIEKTINITSNIYEYDFASDDGKWNLWNAIIIGGVLDIIANNGWGTRYPDSDWLSGADDDFIVEVDFKQDSTVNDGADILLKLDGDPVTIVFEVCGVDNTMRISQYGHTKASQAFVDDVAWHTAKIRRVGTVYYFSIDAGAEISWNYGTARVLEYIYLRMHSCTGDYDNFKYSYKSAWQEQIIDLNNFPIETRDAIKYIQFEVLTNSAFTFYIDQIRANFELTSAYYRDRTAPLNILEDMLAYQDYEWKINKDKKVEFFEVDRDAIDYICPIENLIFEENSVSYFSKIFLIYFDEMMKRQEIELTDENSKIPFDKEHVIGLGGMSDTGAKAIGEAQFEFHKKPRYQLSCLVDNFVFDKNGGVVKSVEIEPNNNVKFLGIKELPIFRIIKTHYSKGICRLTLETEEESTPNIMKSIIEVL